jgi:capsular polysaccharide biosynthesis protein
MPTTADATIRLLMRRWLLLLVVAIVGAGIGIAVSTTRPTKYAASAYLLGHATGAHPADASLVSSSAKVYARAATAPEVIASALRDGNLSLSPTSAAASVNAVASPDTPLLEIRATTDRASVSVALANAVATAVEDYSVSLSAGTGYEMQDFRSATLPHSPVGPGTVLFGFGGGLLALLLAVVLIIVVTDGAGTERDGEETVDDPVSIETPAPPTALKRAAGDR